MTEPTAFESFSALAAASRRTDTDRFLSAGPRFGLVWVTRDLLLSLKYEHNAEPPITAWGWQFEYQFDTGSDGTTSLVELVPMVAGLEQGLSFFSLSVLLGERWSSGELVFGPYLSPNSVGGTFALGYTFQVGEMSLPINVAATVNQYGERYSITTGWNLRR